MKTTLNTRYKFVLCHSVQYNFINFLLILALYYLSYRYPLQINSSTTSPTYSDTPFSLQVGKYIIFAIITYYYSISEISKPFLRLSIFKVFYIIFVLYFFSVSLLISVFTSEISFAQNSIFFLSIIPFFLYYRLSVSELNRFRGLITGFIYINTVVYFLQIILFIIWGRLPALAYSDSISVRFAGIWDDPNGAGLFFIFIIPYLFFLNIKNNRKYILILINLFFLFSTQSLTAIGAFFLSYLVLFIFSLSGKKTRFLFSSTKYQIFTLTYMASLMLLAVILVAEYYYNIKITELASDWYISKEGSINGHASSIDILLNLTASAFAGIDPDPNRLSESGYVNLLSSYGLAAFCMFVVLQLYILIKSFRNLRIESNSKFIEIRYGIASYFVGFLIGMINLPLLQVFPINLIYVLFSIITIKLNEKKSS